MGVSLDVLARALCKKYAIDLYDLRGASRRSRIVAVRSLFCFRAVREEGHPATRVALYLGMSQPGVGYAVAKGKE